MPADDTDLGKGQEKEPAGVEPKRARSDSGVWRNLHQRLLNLLLISHTHREIVAVAAPPSGPLIEPSRRNLATDVLDLGKILGKLLHPNLTSEPLHRLAFHVEAGVILAFLNPRGSTPG